MKPSAWEYHNVTGYVRNRLKPHYLDWGNQPSTYKRYPGREPLPLPGELRAPDVYLSSLLEREPSSPARDIDLETLSLVLLLTYSPTAKARHPSGEFFFRNTASAGALYPSEVYVAAHRVRDLQEGLFYYSIMDRGLVHIRKGDLARAVLDAMEDEFRSTPAATFFLSALFFRSAWKYRDRSYRYHLLDTGHLEENLSLALLAADLPFVISRDFSDREVNHLLGVDASREVCLSLCSLPGQAGSDQGDPERPGPLPESITGASRTAARETDYPLVREIHQAGEEILHTDSSAVVMARELGLRPGGWTDIPPQIESPETATYYESLIRRRSRRNFVSEPLPGHALMFLLDVLLSKGQTEKGQASSGYPFIGVGFLSAGETGVAPGFYLLDPLSRSMGQVMPGSHTKKMARICLDQAWLAHARLQFLFMTNMEVLEGHWGTRGYRYAMMWAGRMGQRLYLAATALGLGCCGIGAFYDSEASELLGLPDYSRLLYLVAAGPVKDSPTMA